MGSLVAELAEKLSSATNNFDIDSGTIYVNTSADTVAIGGTSPDGKFSIHQSASADILNLYDGTDVVFSVLDGGNVGIGTTAPLGLLGIYKSGANADMVIHNLKSASGSRYISAINFLSQNSDNYASWSTWTSTDSAPSFNISYDADTDSIGTTPYLMITDAGNVGIGTTSPSALIHVNGPHASAGDPLAIIQATDNDNTGIGLMAYGSNASQRNWLVAANVDVAGSFGIGYTSNDSNVPTTANVTTALSIDSSGNVGIGTTAPAAKVHIFTETDETDEGADAVLTLGSSTTGKMRMYFGVNDAGNYTYIGSVESGTAYQTLTLQPNGGTVKSGTNVVDAFPSGTKMLFQQTAAPTGWTKVTSSNDVALRVVSGTVGSGGSVAFETAFASKTIPSHTLTIAQMPAHTHNHAGHGNSGQNSFPSGFPYFTTQISSYQTTSTGGGQSHGHGSIDLDVSYVDVIIATKD